MAALSPNQDNAVGQRELTASSACYSDALLLDGFYIHVHTECTMAAVIKRLSCVAHRSTWPLSL